MRVCMCVRTCMRVCLCVYVHALMYIIESRVENLGLNKGFSYNFTQLEGHSIKHVRNHTLEKQL